jgi:hypothetical protein
LLGGQRFVTPEYRGGLLPDGSTLLGIIGDVNQAQTDLERSTVPTFWSSEALKTLSAVNNPCGDELCDKHQPPCGMYGCCRHNPKPRCECLGNWTGQTCDRRISVDWPGWESNVLQTVFVIAALAFTLIIGGVRAAHAQDWAHELDKSEISATRIEELPASMVQQLLALMVLIEYMQFGGTSFRRTVPWTSVDFNAPISFRSIVAYVHVAFKMVLVEYEPGFLAQFASLLLMFVLLGLLGVRKFFQAQTDRWREKVSRCSVAGLTCCLTPFLVSALFVLIEHLSAVFDGTPKPSHYSKTLAICILCGSMSLICGALWMLALRPGNSDVSAFDLFVQFVLPEILIPVVRRLFAPSLGCVFYYSEEYTPCGHTACLGRELTMACSLSNIEYVVLLACGTVVLIPVWGGIVVAIVTYQSDMRIEKPPRWPVMAMFVLFHAQLKVLVAMATDSLRDHPAVMLSVLLFAAAADFMLVAGMQPHQHRTLNRYRMQGAAFAMWACFCAFVALAIDDKTNTCSMLLFVVGYSVVAAIIGHKGACSMIEQCCASAVDYLFVLLGPCSQAVLSSPWVKTLSDLEESILASTLDSKKPLLVPGAMVEVFVPRKQDWVAGRIEAINGQQAEVSYPDTERVIDVGRGRLWRTRGRVHRRRGIMADMNDPSMLRRIEKTSDDDVAGPLKSRPASPDIELRHVGSGLVTSHANSQTQPEPEPEPELELELEPDSSASHMHDTVHDSDDYAEPLLKSRPVSPDVVEHAGLGLSQLDSKQ